MEPYPAPLEFGRRTGHRREQSYPTKGTKADVSVFEDEDENDSKKGWLANRRRGRSGSWLFVGKRRASSPTRPPLPMKNIPRSMPNSPQIIQSTPRFSSDSTDSMGTASQNSSLPSLSTTTSPSLSSSSPRPPSMPPKRPPRPEHGLFENPKDFFTILPAPRPSPHLTKDHESAIDDSEFNGHMSENVEQLMLEVDQAFQEVGAALASSTLGRPSIVPAASPPASRSASMRKRRSQVEPGVAPQIAAPTRKTSVAKRRSHRPSSIIKNAARNAQEKRAARNSEDKTGRWTMTENLADFIRKGRLRRVVVEEILSPRRLDEIGNRAIGDRVGVSEETAATGFDSFNDPVDSRRSSVYSNNGAAVPHPVARPYSREDFYNSQVDAVDYFSNNFSKQRNVTDSGEEVFRRSKSPTAPAPPPKNPARFNRLAVDTMPTIVEGQKDLRPSTADPANRHCRKGSNRKVKKQVSEINLIDFQSAIICGAGDLATGMAEDEEQEMLDDMTDWFDTFGFETEGQLIADSNRRRQHNRDTSQSVESVRSLDSTTSTISEDLDLPIPTSTLNQSQLDLAQQNSMHESDKIVVCEDEQKAPRSPEAKVRMSCNFTDDLDAFLEWTPAVDVNANQMQH